MIRKIELIETDFAYAMKQNKIDETYFHQLFNADYWQQNREVLVRAFLEFSVFDTPESFGQHCKKCGEFNSDRQETYNCRNCGTPFYDE